MPADAAAASGDGFVGQQVAANQGCGGALFWLLRKDRDALVRVLQPDFPSDQTPVRDSAQRPCPQGVTTDTC